MAKGKIFVYRDNGSEKDYLMWFLGYKNTSGFPVKIVPLDKKPSCPGFW